MVGLEISDVGVDKVPGEVDEEVEAVLYLVMRHVLDPRHVPRHLHVLMGLRQKLLL